MAQLVLLGRKLPDLHLFLVDEFQRLNGFSEEQVTSGRANLIEGLEALESTLGVSNSLMLASDIMDSDEYRFTYQQVSRQVRGKDLERALLATVPERYRHHPGAVSYPLHEVACVAQLQQLGFQTKIGPSTEQQYDKVIDAIGIPMAFGYLAPAYALGLQEAHEVVHYSPNHLPKGGQRLLLDDPDESIRNKVLQGSEAAVRALGRLAVLSAEAQGNGDPRAATLERPFGKPVKKAVAGMVIDNIMKPYRQARYGR